MLIPIDMELMMPTMSSMWTPIFQNGNAKRLGGAIKIWHRSGSRSDSWLLDMELNVIGTSNLHSGNDAGVSH